MEENKKVTIMVLKVELQCEKCYRKVKKLLCKFPQIRDQMYDEKNNQVIIKVVCCTIEKIRDKLFCRGRCVIKSIDIKEPPLPEKVKPPQEKTEKEKPPQEKTEKEKPPPENTEKEKPPPENTEKEKPPPVPCTCPPVPPSVKCPRPPVTCPPVTWPRPLVKTCCTECYGGHPGGPCQTGYCRRPVYDSCGGWRSAGAITLLVTA